MATNLSMKVAENFSGSLATPSVPSAGPINSRAQAVYQQAGYGAGIKQGARQFREMIIILWVGHLLMIFTHRLLTRDKPLSIELNNPITGETVYKKALDYELSDRQELLVEHLDNILFTINFALLSILMVLQFMDYGKITTNTVMR